MIRLTVLALSAAAMLPAQSAFTGELKAMYNGVKNNLTKMAEVMPEENYAFKPTPEIRTFGELVGHVADSQARACSAVNGEPKQLNAGKMTAKADLVAAIKESFAICDAAFNSLSDESAGKMIKMGPRERSVLGTLAGTVSHSNEEYGYMAVYLRLKGVVPPSSAGR